jgi:hypothetical protein
MTPAGPVNGPEPASAGTFEAAHVQGSHYALPCVCGGLLCCCGAHWPSVDICTSKPPVISQLAS